MRVSELVRPEVRSERFVRQARQLLTNDKKTVKPNHPMKITKFLTYSMVAVSLCFGLALQAVAQAPGGGRGGILTQDQRTKMREAMQASQSEMTQLTEKLAAAQKEAVKAALAKDADEKSVRPKLEAVAKIQTDIAVLR